MNYPLLASRLGALGCLSLTVFAACAVETDPNLIAANAASGAPAQPGAAAGSSGAPVTTAGAATSAGSGGAGVGGDSLGNGGNGGALPSGGMPASSGASGSQAAGQGGVATAGAAGSAGASSGGAGGSGGALGGNGGGGAGGMPATGVGLKEGKQTKRPINAPFAKNGYLEYLPKGYGDGTKRPLIVFWAGIGENSNGSEGALDLMYRHGPPMLIQTGKWPSERPFVVLSPQHNGQLPYDRPTPTETHDFIEFALSHYDLDPARVYLTSLSSGAKGSWDYLAVHKGSQVAATALIAGDASEPWGNVGCALVNAVAVWDFHGTADTEQPYDADKKGMDGFKSCAQPHKEVKFTTYDGWGHADAFNRTYDGSAGNDIYAWFLTKSR